MEIRPGYGQPASEISLGELITTVWQGKWLIAAVMALCVSLAAVYLLLTPKTYSTQIEIRPITSFQAEPYEFINRLEFFDIQREDLLTLFGERLATREDIREAVIEHSLVDRNLFDDDAEYHEEVREFVNALTMEGPGIGGDSDRTTLSIRLIGRAPQSASAAYRDALTNANEFVRTNLQTRFNALVSAESQLRQSELEDITRQIEGARTDYDLKIEQKLALLTEQAQIARELQLDKPTTEGPTLLTPSAVSIGMIQKQPYYLYGYEAIEKEITLIEARADKDDFIPELAELERKQRELIDDPFLDRAEAAFEATPITSPEQFQAARWNISASDFKPDTRSGLVLALAVVLGGMLGLFALFIKVAINSTNRCSANNAHSS